VTLAALLVFALFAALVLPGEAAQTDVSGEDVGSPDLSLFYSADKLYRMAEAYGPEGRRAYIRARYTFDVAWPLVFTAFLTTSISWLTGRAYPLDSRWQLANLAPIIGGLADYMENLSASLVMWRYPARTPVVDVLAPVFTFVKWVFVGASFVLLVVSLVVALRRWVRVSRP
jgi:hypothetical protein